MIKNYLAIGVLLAQYFAFSQATLIEKYDFDNGSLVGQNGTNNYQGSNFTFIDDKDGNAGQAVDLNGSQSYPLKTVTTNTATGLTVSFWLKPSATVSGSFSVLSTRSTCKWGNFMEVVGNSTNKTISGGFRTSSQTAAFVSLPFTPEVWTKYTYVYDNTKKYVFGYVNGIKTDSTAYQNGVSPSNLTTNVLGVATSPCVGVDGTTRYKGGLDQLEIFDKALSVSEVADMKNFPDRTNSLAAEFKFQNFHSNLIPDAKNIADKAIEVNGNEAILLGNPTINPTNGFSMAFWVKPSATNADQFSVISKRGVCTWENLLEVVGNSNLSKISGGFRTSSKISTFIGLPYVSEQWNHLTYVFDNNTKYLYGYVNGVKTDSVKYTNNVSPTSFSPNTQLSIAGSPCVNVDGTKRYKGGIDELALYNGVLTNDEVSAMYNAGIITGLYDNENTSLAIYPNPATSTLNLPKGQVVIYNVRGEEILNTYTDGKLDISNLTQGLYLVRQNEKTAQLIVE